MDEESIRKEYRASAIHNIRWHFMKRKLIEQEDLSVTDEEIQKLIDESQLDEKIKDQARKDQHYLDHLKEDLLERKVIEFLKSNADIVEVYPPEEKATK